MKRLLAGLSAMLILSGAVIAFGSSEPAGATHTEYVDVDLTPDGLGMWVTLADGTVEARGVATPHYGDRPTLEAGEHVVALASTAVAGYWLFTSRGNVFPFGDAGFFGDVAHLQLAGEVIAAVPTPTGLGYYMLGTDGGIFTFGDADFFGSLPGLGVVPVQPVVGMSVTPGGYLLVAADGGTFALGNAAFFGSLPSLGVIPARPIVGLAHSPAGYLLLGGDSGIFNFGVSEFHGSAAGLLETNPAVGVSVASDLSGYVMLTDAGVVLRFGSTRTIAPIAVYSGSSSAVVDLPALDQPIILAITTDDTGFWVVHGLDDQNATEWFGPGEIGALNIGWYLLLDPSNITRLELDFDDEYVVGIYSIGATRIWQYSTGDIDGVGPDVILLPPIGPQIATTAVAGDGFHNIARFLDPEDLFGEDLFSDSGTGTNQVPLTPSGAESVISVEVNQDVGWSIGFS